MECSSLQIYVQMNTNLRVLREFLHERYPLAHDRSKAQPGTVLREVHWLDAIGGIPKASITEVITQTGGGLFLAAVLKHLRQTRQLAALVDGRDSLDPVSLGAYPCEGLLWLRCQQADQAVKVTDLLLRDGNLPFVLLDLQLNEPRELAGVASSTWYRLRNLAEESHGTLLVLTPVRLVVSAALRLELTGSFQVKALEIPRSEVESQLRMRVLRSPRKETLET